MIDKGNLMKDRLEGVNFKKESGEKKVSITYLQQLEKSQITFSFMLFSLVDIVSLRYELVVA